MFAPLSRRVIPGMCLEVHCRLPGILYYWLPLHTTRRYHPSAMSLRGAACCGKTWQYRRTGMYWYAQMRVRYILYGSPLYYGCIAQYDDAMHTVRITYCSTVLTRFIRGGALSAYHTWNDITMTPTRRTRLARRDNHFFHGWVPCPLCSHRYHEVPLIRCEWRDRVDRQTTSIW